MELVKAQNSQSTEFCDVSYRIDTKKNAVRIRKRIKCESCGRFFLQRVREIRHCIHCGDGVSIGQ